MMKTALLPLLLLALPAAASTLPPPSLPPTLGQAFGNTIVSTYPDGKTAWLWLNPDGSFTGKGRWRAAYSGEWRVKGDQVCLKELRPIHIPFSYCTPIPAGGETWAGKAATGEHVTFHLLRGVVEPAPMAP